MSLKTIARGLGVGIWLLGLAAQAQSPAEHAPSARVFDEVAESLVTMMEPRWTGARVPHPDEVPRPALPLARRSLFSPLAVHADASVPAERVDAVLRALEHAYLLSDETGFGLPWPDGGRGGTGGFDLYLSPSARGADAYADAPLGFTFLDGVSSYATVDPNVDDSRLESCVAQALAEASFLGQDPAEARQWRHAYGAWLAFAQTGRFGCEDPVAAQQEEPWRSYVNDGAGDGGGGALLLEALSLPRDGGTGAFVRDVVQFARQRTWQGEDLRASPDLWETIRAVTEHSGEKLPYALLRLAEDRYFLGSEGRRVGATNRGLFAADMGAEVPLFWRTRWGALPAHSPPMEPALEPYGSSYAIVDVRDAPANAVLRVWLRGEYGVEWSMGTMRLDAQGHELGRMRAPPRGDTPRGYLPVQLDPGTASVVIVALSLSGRLPDADTLDENVRTFQLIVDAEAPSPRAPSPAAPRAPAP